jgi:hypothetical protein
MLIQIQYNKELQFLAYLVPVIMGIQLALYFFYQYKKLEDKDLPLNKILLAFGSFIIFIVFGPLLIQIARNFILNGDIYEIVYRIGWILAFSSTIAFSMFIINKDFSLIINLKVARTLLVLNFIPIILTLMLPSLKSPLFIISILLVVLNGLYIIRFQIILIQKSVGQIKKKVRLFLIGALISFVALIFAILVGLQLFSPSINQIVYFMGIIDLFIGFVTIYFSVYNFPPFYEFEWRDNLLKLFIIDGQNFRTLYYLDLIQNSYDVPDKIFPRGISGIEKIISLITDTKAEKINKIQQDENLIKFEYGLNPSSLVYMLMVKKDLISSNHLLRLIRKQFESFYKDILTNLDELNEDQNQLFLSFNIIMDNILQKG